MADSFDTSVTGLIAHQNLLNVAGNNIANVNTTGFKTQRMSFADTLYEIQRSASSAGADSAGGINPIAIGTGVAVRHVDRDFSQGGIEITNQPFDLAILGDGFFVLDNGTQQVLTRAGTFDLDENFNLVDKGTGSLVQRTGNVGQDINVGGFQISGDSSIRIPIGETIAGVPTETINIRGNLNALSESPSPRSFSSANPLITAGNPATASTPLNSLDGASYQVGDIIHLSGISSEGLGVSAQVTVAADSTVSDILETVNAEFGDATATIDENGNLSVTSNFNGASLLSIRMADATTNVGDGIFAADPFVLTSEGTLGDVASTAIEFYDLNGGLQAIQIDLVKTDSGWEINASIDEDVATLPPNPLGMIQFDSTGALIEEAGSSAKIPITINYPDSDSIQTMQLNLGKTESFDGITQTSSGTVTFVNSDGFGVGSLISATVEQDGIVTGVGSNGRRIPLAQLAIARVANENGLTAIGENHFTTSSNSGDAEIGEAAAAGRGRIQAGQLESSNVDLAFELTRLIIAQRGFSANARGITIAQEIMDEVTNIIR